MKKMRNIFAMLVAMVMAFAIALPAFAEDGDGEAAATATTSTPSITIISTATSQSSKTDNTQYKAWKMLDASIAEDPTQSGAAQSGGKVSYYVTTTAAKDALVRLFDFTQVGSENRWYATLKSGKTAQDVVNALKNKTDAEMTAAFGTPKEFAQTKVGGSATSGTVDPGYYFIKSSLGSNIAIQTLTAVEIDEKNQYVTDEKTIPPLDVNSEIGQDIEYTLTVNVPASANDKIVLTDTMGKGLTYKSITQDSNITGVVSPVSEPDQNGATNFTITYAADDIKALVANGAATITVKVTVYVNSDAAVDETIPNTLDLKYGNNYEAVPSTVYTKTTQATFDKVDGDNGSMLTGAEFTLLKDTEEVGLVAVTAGEEYRVAAPDDDPANVTTKIVTVGKTVTIKGLDADITYNLQETKAPAGGYNMLEQPVPLAMSGTTFGHTEVQNNKGSVLPSTGGIGTTIFYIVGGAMVAGAAIFLLTKRRMSGNAQ